MKNKGISILRACIIGVGVLVILYFGILIVTSLFVARSREAWTEDMYTNGPWSEEAIWKSTDGNMYLVCTEKDMGEGKPVVEVKAYIKEKDMWVHADFGIRSNSKKCYIDLLNEDVSLTGEMQLKNGILTITGLESNSNDTIMEEGEKIQLEKYEFDLLVETLPFEIDKSE